MRVPLVRQNGACKVRALQEQEDVGYFEPQERRTEQINVRVTKTVRDSLVRLADIWSHVEQIRSGDTDATVSVSDVVMRLIQIGLQGAWAEIGLEAKTDAELAAVKRKAEEVFARELAERGSSNKKK